MPYALRKTVEKYEAFSMPTSREITATGVSVSTSIRAAAFSLQAVRASTKDCPAVCLNSLPRYPADRETPSAASCREKPGCRYSFSIISQT